MANNGTIQDLDEWLLKLDNLQRALKSCSSSQPRRLQSPLVFPREQPVDGVLFRPMKNDGPLPAVHLNHPQTPFTISPQRRYPQPPIRKVFPSATEPPQRKFRPLTSPVHHYFPGEQFPMPNRNSNGNGLDEQNGNHIQLQQNQQNSQHQPKSKTVRWSSEPATDRLQGIKKLVSDLDSVEADLVNAASENSRNRNNRPSSPSDMPEIPPPPAFTNGSDHVDYNSFPGPDSNDVILLRQQVPSPSLRHSPVPLYRSGSPATDRSSLQSQDTYNTLTRGRSPQSSDWIGNLHFWKSLQNREVVDSLNSRNQNDDEQDKKVVLRIHQPDRTTKAVYVQSRTDAGEVVLMLAAKNFLPLSTKMALVEKVPSMKLERCFEDDEVVRDCVLSWPVSNENLIFFEERQDLFGIFEDPQDILEKDGANRLPPFKDYLYILRPNNKWKRRYCVLRSSGLYASKKQGSGISELVRVTAFGEHLHLYTTSGGWKKDNTPTPYGFVLKPHSVVKMDPHMVRAFCAANEESLRIWCSLLRIILMGPRLLQTYRQRLAACALNYQLSPEDTATGNEDSTLTDGNLAEMVRQKYARESNLYSGAGVRESARQYARLPAVARARSVSQIQAHIANRQGSLSCSQVSLIPADQFRSSVGDLGFVSGRADVGRTLSMNELNAVDQKLAASSTQSLNASQCISSLLNPLRWSRRNIDEAVTPQPMRRVASRKGPAARKCNRSTGNLHRPHSISPSSSVFFLPPANCDASARTSAAVEDDIMTTSQHNLQEPMNQSQTLQIPATPMLINNSGQQQRPGGPPMPHSPRRSGHFAGIRPQLLPSQLSPVAL
ncbi:unnamed protein product [Hymenolepis diminuta]|uniref:Ras-associating domain-containing protein n=1 Tax=Hymenolepis diminuta TaxID=6216 RepID=A0A0R3S8K8_HYMDI|nr:unnamed protein product [Hymenolepis diminuta]